MRPFNRPAVKKGEIRGANYAGRSQLHLVAYHDSTRHIQIRDCFRTGNGHYQGSPGIRLQKGQRVETPHQPTQGDRSTTIESQATRRAIAVKQPLEFNGSPTRARADDKSSLARQPSVTSKYDGPRGRADISPNFHPRRCRCASYSLCEVSAQSKGILDGENSSVAHLNRSPARSRIHRAPKGEIISRQIHRHPRPPENHLIEGCKPRRIQGVG